jgi:hypothetical protein
MSSSTGGGAFGTTIIQRVQSSAMPTIRPRCKVRDEPSFASWPLSPQPARIAVPGCGSRNKGSIAQRDGKGMMAPLLSASGTAAASWPLRRTEDREWKKPREVPGLLFTCVLSVPPPPEASFWPGSLDSVSPSFDVAPQQFCQVLRAPVLWRGRARADRHGTLTVLRRAGGKEWRPKRSERKHAVRVLSAPETNSVVPLFVGPQRTWQDPRADEGGSDS